MKNIVIAAIALASASVAPAQGFTGGWVDARGGWDSVQLKISTDDFGVSSSKSGFLYGAAAGYDFALSSNVVAGVSGGIYGSTAKACFDDGEDGVCLKAGRDFEALGRIGYIVNPAAMIYVLGGYANGQISDQNSDDSETRGGFRIGAGVEYAVSTHVALKAEYRYTSYKKEEFDGGSFGFNRNQVLLGVGYRF
jgi:outer membrane immunogenic protein